MKTEEFYQSLSSAEAPIGLSVYLQALWYDGKNDWEKAHTLIQDLSDRSAAWVHAYLHRKEGDIGNADYWYSRAGRKRPPVSLKDEWKDMVSALLE